MGVREAATDSTEAEAELAATSLGETVPDIAEGGPTVARLAALAVEEVEHTAVEPDPLWELKEVELPSDCLAGGRPSFLLSDRFGALEVEELALTGDVLLTGDTAYAPPPGRPPEKATPCRGPRAPREVRDLETYLMRPVPMRRRTESARVLAAHASFLQYWYRRTRASAAARLLLHPDAPTAWSPGGMRGLLPIFRPVTRTRCTDGIASEDDFAAQRRRARRVLMWYRQYAELLRKLMGRQPELVDLFCGEGGVSEGIRRAGLAATGVDMRDMPRYRQRFGTERFILADAYLPSTMQDAVGS